MIIFIINIKRDHNSKKKEEKCCKKHPFKN